MDKAEFDKFVDKYRAIHQENIRASSEAPDFFAEYKVKDIAEHTDGIVDASTILDFGSGIGASVPHVQHYFPQGSLTCLDVSQRSIESAREVNGAGAGFVVFDGATIPFDDDSFDIAFAACIFHHINPNHHTRLLEELRRMLKSGGVMFVFEHNPFNPLIRYAVNTCPFGENAVLISGRHLKNIFTKAGFSDVRLKNRFLFPYLLLHLRKIEPLLTWPPLGAQYYVSGRKPEAR